MIRLLHRQNWRKCISNNLFGKFGGEVTAAENQLVKEASEMYFGIEKDGFEGEQMSKEQLHLLVDLGTDSNFAHGTDLALRRVFQSTCRLIRGLRLQNVTCYCRSLQRHTKADVFSYRFDHIGSFSISDLIGGSRLRTAARWEHIDILGAMITDKSCFKSELQGNSSATTRLTSWVHATRTTSFTSSVRSYRCPY